MGLCLTESENSIRRMKNVIQMKAHNGKKVLSLPQNSLIEKCPSFQLYTIYNINCTLVRDTLTELLIIAEQENKIRKTLCFESGSRMRMHHWRWMDLAPSCPLPNHREKMIKKSKNKKTHANLACILIHCPVSNQMPKDYHATREKRPVTAYRKRKNRHLHKSKERQL